MLAGVSTPLAIVVVVLAGYVLGSIPIADLVARRQGVVDLREVGDRNPGYWNAMTQLGRDAALPVFLGDVAKGAAAAGVGLALAADDQWWLGYLGGGAAMVGHSFPAFARFRGGRSVLAFVGAASVLAPAAAVCGWAVLGAIWLWSRRFDWAARGGVTTFPIWQLLIEGPYRTAATGALMTFVGARFGMAAIRSRTSDPATPDAGSPH